MPQQPPLERRAPISGYDTSVDSGEQIVAIKPTTKVLPQSIEDMLELVAIEKGHPRWRAEIHEGVSSELIKPLSEIASEFGSLGVLVYLRFTNSLN